MGEKKSSSIWPHRGTFYPNPPDLSRATKIPSKRVRRDAEPRAPADHRRHRHDDRKGRSIDKRRILFPGAKVVGIKAPFWQRGFSEIRVLDSDSFENHRRYIHNNPVKAHLVGKAEEYPYSSASRTSGLDPMPDQLRPAFSALFYEIG
ncbi:MAG TPA: hypothetical protein VFA40_05105 [Terriglobales bacterium]|nr:hypothetical protein [Terriglobales bacterium]